MPKFQTLMPIRKKGDEAPLFCVHGQPLRIAQRLQTGRPIYGLSHVYYSDFLAESPASMEELAATYLEEIQQVQPHGPYHFCGFSAGGLIAYEIARQLRARGETIDCLTLIEPTVAYRPKTASNSLSKWYNHSSNRLQFILTVIGRIPRAMAARAVLIVKRAQAWLLMKTGRPLPERLRWLGYLKSLGPAMSKYYYEPVDARATIVYGRVEEEFQPYYREFWEKLLERGAKIEFFDDVLEHNDFMVDPALTKTAELLDRDRL